jgi:hypothetical protein
MRVPTRRSPVEYVYQKLCRYVAAFMGGNAGVCMGRWFRREIKALDDVKFLMIRALGLRRGLSPPRRDAADCSSKGVARMIKPHDPQGDAASSSRLATGFA